MKESPARSIWTPVLFALTLATGIFFGFRLQNDAPLLSIGRDAPAGRSGNSSVDELMRYIDAKYVDTVDNQALNEAAIDAILENLDPHSTYIPADELQSITEQMEGNFEGIGIEYLVVDDTITVMTAIPGGPSETAGLRPGDQIIYVEDSLVTDVSAIGLDPASLMRGVGGTDVSIRIKRYPAAELLPFTITRDAIPVYSVDAAYNIDPDITYVRINRFSATTYDEFVKALEENLEKGGAKNLIIDLRGNPGGYLQQATKLLSQLFVQKGQLLVYTQGRRSRRTDYETNGRAFYNIQNVAILIDGGSASASEIVAGAIQDHDRGIVVGRRSFGKGLVQEQYPLRDGSALRLTVARYYTPSGRSIQRSYEDGQEAYRGDISRRLDAGELTGETEALTDSSIVYFTDNGYKVFGGGGITPDYFVPLDSIYNDLTFLRLRQEIPAYVFRFLRQNNGAQFSDITTFKRGFEYDRRAAIEDLETMARANYPEETIDAGTMNAQLRLAIDHYFRARVARQLFGPAAFYEVYNDHDEVVQQALELMRGEDPIAEARGE